MSQAAATQPAPALEWAPRFNPWLIALAVMSATFLEVLDTSVANVALPHIAGSMSATTDEATWVLTSYLVANAIILPMTAWFSAVFGRKRFLLACIVLFTLASAACGLATTLGMLVLARVIQGAGGGALQPLSQAILLESFPPRRRGVAMAAFGMGVVVAPIIGPTMGGWITDNYSWRWVFYINLPIGIAAVMMVLAFVEDPPYIRRMVSAAKGRIDFMGFGLLAVWLATLQIILDRGQEVDWFAAPWVRWFAVISGVAMVAFIVRELVIDNPVVNLRVLKERNFAVGTLLIALVGVVLYGTIAILPLFLQELMGYPALDSGLALSPRGIGAILAMVVVGRLIARVDGRFLIAFGFIVLTYAAWQFAGINLNITLMNVAWPNIVMGVAMGFVFVPLATVTMADLPQADMGSGSGLFNLMRNIGGGIGISLVTTMLARGAQRHQAYLAAHISAYSQTTRQQLGAMQAALAQVGDPGLAKIRAYGLVQGMVQHQAAAMAYLDAFRFLAGTCLVCIPLVLLFHRPRHTGPAVAAH